MAEQFYRRTHGDNAVGTVVVVGFRGGPADDGTFADVRYEVRVGGSVVAVLTDEVSADVAAQALLGITPAPSEPARSRRKEAVPTA